MNRSIHRFRHSAPTALSWLFGQNSWWLMRGLVCIIVPLTISGCKTETLELESKEDASSTARPSISPVLSMVSASSPAGQTLSGDDLPDMIEGGDGPDTLLGHDGDDLLAGGDGDDVIIAGNGNDLVYGGDGDDLLIGDIDDAGVGGNLPFCETDRGVGRNFVATGTTYSVSSEADFDSLPTSFNPGDHILIENGTYTDIDFILKGIGTESAPIVMEAATPGGAFFTGASSMDLDGEYLVLKGVTFRDGVLEEGRAAISFRNDSTRDRTNNSRLTEVVIDNYGPAPGADPTATRRYVALYGKNNQVDHNVFSNHQGAGVTVEVRLEDDISDNSLDIENFHDISCNYFASRAASGANGYETIRIGTSAFTEMNSNTSVRHNYFEQTNGEAEVISVKSGQNEVYGNVFDRVQGSVVIRFGSFNSIYRNVFLGGSESNTGGIRITDTDNKIHDNYIEGVAGTGFRSAIAIMSGDTGAVISNYERVARANIYNNTIVDSREINIGLQSSALPDGDVQGPTDSLFTDNLIAFTPDNFELDYTFPAPTGDVDTDKQKAVDIDYVGNLTDRDDASLSGSGEGNLTGTLPDGTGPIATLQSFTMARQSNGLLYSHMNNVGAPIDLDPVERAETGPDWYSKPDLQAP